MPDPEASRAEYLARVHRVLDAIEADIAHPFTLEELSRVACFSPFHFHRVFAAMTGETPQRFVQRVRLERAAGLLLLVPGRPVSEVASECGLGAPSAFSRAFKAHFGVSATEWRRRGGHGGMEDRNHGQADRNPDRPARRPTFYLEPASGKPAWRFEMNEHQDLPFEVKVEDLPDQPVIYLRHVGPYQGDAALFGRLWEQIVTWASAHDLFHPPETRMMCVYHDAPGVTEPDRLRLSVCLTAPVDARVAPPFGRMVLQGGRVALARFVLGPQDYGRAWAAVYGEWLPRSGYQCDDRPPYELYGQMVGEGPDTRHEVWIAVPVRPL